MEARELLGDIAFFSETLDAQQLDVLAKVAKRRTYPKGSVLMKEGDDGRSMFVIEDGSVNVTLADEPKPVATLYAGDIIGEASFLMGAKRSASVVAAEDVDAVEIDKSCLAPILAKSPALVDRFAEMFEQRQEELDNLSGGAAWGMLRPGDAEVHHLIREFYARK
jgi:CRP-like cAMP-binding protein